MTSIKFRTFFMPLAACGLCLVLSLASCGSSAEKKQDTATPTPTAKPNNLNVDQLTEMIAKEPGNSQLYYERALAYYEYGDLSSALKDFDKTLELEPEFASAFHDRGICRFELDMDEEALADFTKAIELDPTYYEAYYNRALIYDEKGKQKEALADLNKAIEINPEFGDAYYNRAVYLLNTDREQACADFKKASDLGIQEAGLTMQQYCK